MTDALWTESQIEERLGHIAVQSVYRTDAKALLLEMAHSYEAQLSDLEVHVDSLERALFRAQHPADAYLSIKPNSAFTVKLQQCVNIITNDHLWATNAAATDKLVTNARQLYAGTCLHMSEGFGVAVAWPDPTKPANWSSLKSQLAFAARVGKPVMLNLYCPPWWMRANGTTRMTSAAAFKHSGRLMTSMIPQWQQMVEEGVTVFANAMLAQDANTTIELDINNEWKMFQEIRRVDKVIEGQRWADGDHPGTPGNVGDMDFPPFAKLTYEAALRATDKLGIPRERAKVGASYPVITFQAAQNADSVPTTHPLFQRPYGTARKAPLLAFDRYLAYFKRNNLPVDFLSIDASTRNKDQVAVTDDFSNCVRFYDLTQHIRHIATVNGFPDLEVAIKELYGKGQGRGADNLQLDPVANTPIYRAAVKVRALMEAAKGGAGRVYWWGWSGEGDDPGTVANGAAIVGVDKPGGGETTLVYDTLRQFAETFPVGATAYEMTMEGEGVSALATDAAYYVLNETDGALEVCVGDEVVTLEAYGVGVVAR